MTGKKKLWIGISVALALLLVGGLILCQVLWVKQKKDEDAVRQMFRDYYDAKVEQYEAENASVYGVDVAFIGDSLTDGYDLSLYYPEFSVTNRGIGGDTTFGVEERLKVSLYDANPRVIVMMIGSNNIYTMFENYEGLLRSIKENLPDTELVLLSIPPTAGNYKDRNVRIALNNVRIEALAKTYGCHYVDVFSSLLDHKTEELRAEYTSDSVHFTPLGYEVITAHVKPVLTDLLNK